MNDHSAIPCLIPESLASLPAGTFNPERLVTGLGQAAADGLACVWCDADYLKVRVPRVPFGRSESGSQVFVCTGECAGHVTIFQVFEREFADVREGGLVAFRDDVRERAGWTDDQACISGEYQVRGLLAEATVGGGSE